MQWSCIVDLVSGTKIEGICYVTMGWRNWKKIWYLHPTGMMGATPDQHLGEEISQKVAKKSIPFEVRMNSYWILPFTSISTQTSRKINIPLLPFHPFILYSLVHMSSLCPFSDHLAQVLLCLHLPCQNIWHL